MAEDTTPQTMADVLARVEASWANLLQLVGPLSGAQLTEPGADAGWSVKDHLAHITTWERILLATLAGAPLHELLGLDKAASDAITSTDELNAIIDSRNKALPIDDVMAALRETHAALVQRLRALSDSDLQRTVAFFQPEDDGDNRPILGKIAGDSYEHYAAHLPWIQALVERQRY